jgi:hypothetical protein
MKFVDVRSSLELWIGIMLRSRIHVALWVEKSFVSELSFLAVSSKVCGSRIASVNAGSFISCDNETIAP